MRCKWWGVRILVAILAFGIVWGGMPAQLVRAQDAETATPYAYVVKDGEKLNVILYEALKNSYFAYRSNPDRHEARLAKYYMGLLRSAASSGKKVDEVIISYVSSISRQHVDYRKLADKYMALRRKAKPTYAWLNSWTADAGRIANKYVEVINDDRIVQYGYWLDADGYRLETQVAPTGLTGVAPTTGANNDGKITGVNTTMEYKLKSASPWNAVTGTVITGLASGTYEVRYKAKPGYAASPATQVVVPPYVPKPIVEAITITATVAGNPYNPDYSLPNNEGVTVKLETATTGAEIYYTLDGTTPTADSEKYDNEIIVDSSALDEPANGGTVVLKAIAVKSGHTNSAVATLEIEFDAAAPKYTVTFSVVGGNGELEAAIQNPFGWENVTSGDKVDGGLDVIFTATPDPGYQVKEWKKDGVVVGDAGTTYTVADLAADVEVTVEFKLIVSTYQYVYELPDEDILAMVGFDFDLATENVLVGTQGYARALNRISLEGPGSLTFVGKDSLGHEITQVIDEDNDGYWGPLSGFPLPAEIPTGEMANTFNLTFSEAGDYTVRVWLEDLDTGAVITELEEDIEVKADTTPPVASKLHYQYNPYIGGDNYGSLVTVEENIVNDEATLVFWQRDILHRLSIEVTDDNLDETDVTVYRLDYNGQPKVDWGTLKYDSVSGVFELDMTPFEALDGSDPEALALATLQDGNKLQATFKDSFGNETVVTVTVEIPQITVSALDENYYAAGDTLSFTISGLRPNQEVRVGMPIWTGASGWPWASSKLVLTTGMVGDDTERYWVGTTNEDGELLVSGEVGSGLPYGELHITLPDYDVFIDNNIRLQDEQGDPVYVGVLSDKAKADFLAKLAAEAAAITASGVADVELDEEDITVTFMSNASPGAIYDAAEDLLGVFKDELQAASMTITRAGESTGQTFDLHAAGVVEAVAGYLLNGMSPAEFLAQRDPILATYTATATDKYGVEFDLAGDLVFAVEATPDKAKADFLAKLAAEAAAITASGVADVELDEEDITVTFMSDASPGAIYDAAEDLLAVFQAELSEASMTIELADGTERTFDLHAAGVVEAVAGLPPERHESGRVPGAARSDPGDLHSDGDGQVRCRV
ncbi:MAG: chitobiase/beta-hexosaminidase C-terminal domain-containing protein [Saccharofermentanales bacterium]